MVSRDLEKQCIVVFDEAHNIDNVCIEVRPLMGHRPCCCGVRHPSAFLTACSSPPTCCSKVFWLLQALSVNLRQQTLDAASRNIGRLKAAIERVKATDADRLRDEYNRLVSGLQVFLALELEVTGPASTRRLVPATSAVSMTSWVCPGKHSGQRRPSKRSAASARARCAWYVTQSRAKAVCGWQEQGTLPGAPEQGGGGRQPRDDMLASPALPDDILREAVSCPCSNSG